MSDQPSGLYLPKTVYDVLKPVALVLLPALSAFYFGLSQLWGLPYAIQVVGTIALVDTALGAILGISTKSFNNSPDRFDGVLQVSETDTSQIHQFEFKTPPEQLAKQSEMVLRVDQVPPPQDSPPIG